MMRRDGWLTSLSALVLGLGVAGPIAKADEPTRKQETVWPGMTRAGTVLLPNGWSLRPAGRQAKLGDFPVLIAEHPREPILAILHSGYGEHEVITVRAEGGKIIGRYALPETFAGLVWSHDGKRLYAGGGFDDVIHAFDHADGLLSNRTTLKYPEAEGKGRIEGHRVPAGLAISRDGRALWAANAFGHSVSRFDLASGKMVEEIAMKADSYPYGLAWDESRSRLYVSLWGKAEVAVIDTETSWVVGHWTTQEHPNEMLLARGGKALYVANANRNSVSVFDAEAGKSVETIGTAIAPNAPAGSTPSSLSLSPDGSMLFIANADTNNVAVVNVKELGASTPLGFIPTGWYPTSVRVARDGKALYVANGKGTTSKANREDRADDLTFNEIIWKAVRGPDSPMPPPVRAAFVLPRR